MEKEVAYIVYYTIIDTDRDRTFYDPISLEECKENYYMCRDIVLRGINKGAFNQASRFFEMAIAESETSLDWDIVVKEANLILKSNYKWD